MASKVIHFHSFPITLENKKDAPFPNDSNEPNYVPGKFRQSEQFEFSRARPSVSFTSPAGFRSKQKKSPDRARAEKEWFESDFRPFGLRRPRVRERGSFQRSGQAQKFPYSLQF